MTASLMGTCYVFKIISYIHLFPHSSEIPDSVKLNVIILVEKLVYLLVCVFKMIFFFFTLEIELSWWFFTLGYLYFLCGVINL